MRGLVGIFQGRTGVRGRTWAPLFLLAAAVLLTVAATSGSAAAQSKKGARAAKGAQTPRHPEELQLEPLHLRPIAAVRETLACGIPVILHESHDLPILDLTLQLRMGTRYLPAELHPACGLFSELWRDGGTAELSPDALDAALTALDARVGASVGLRSGSVTISLSSEDAAAALPLWRDVALRPRFDPERLVRAKANRLQELQAINNDPGRIASRQFEWLLLGRDFPSVRLTTRAEIEAVTPEQIRSLHARFVRPENAILGVSGDFDRETMLALLDRLFADWPVTGPYEPPVADVWTPQPRPGLYVLRGDYGQSQVRVGRIVEGLTDDSPEFAASQILSYALGYGRIFYRTREEGLTYGSAITLSVGPERATLNGGGPCRGDATVPLLRAMFEECRRLEQDPIAGDGLEAARTYFIGSEVRASETAAAIVATKVADALRGRPDDFRERLLERYQQTTSEDVDRLARAHVTVPDPWIVLVLGNPDAFVTPLDSLGLGPATEVPPVVFGE